MITRKSLQQNEGSAWFHASKRTPKNSKQKQQTARVGNFSSRVFQKNNFFHSEKCAKVHHLVKTSNNTKRLEYFHFRWLWKSFLTLVLLVRVFQFFGGVSWEAKKDSTSHFSLSLCTMTSLFQDDEKSWFLPSNDRQSRIQNFYFSPSFIVQTTPPVNLSGSSTRCSLGWVKYTKASLVCVCARCTQKSAFRMKLEFPKSCIICWLQKEGRRGWKEARRSLRESR